MKKIILKLMLISIVTFAFLFGGCSQIPKQINNKQNSTIIENLDLSSDEIKFFSTKQELISFLEKQESQSQDFSYRNNMKTENIEINKNSFDGSMVKDAAPTAKAGAGDFSKTNNQVENVDESDIVKNDGKYIYTISENKLVIIDAFPAENSQIVSTIKFDETEKPINIFLNDNKLIIFTNNQEKRLKVSAYSFVPEEQYFQKTHLYIYDISDKEKPKQIKDYSVSGNFYDARMINKTIYLISREYSYFYRGDIETPVILENNVKIASPSIYYFNMPYYSQNFNTITSLNLEDFKLDTKSFMLDSSDTLYVSENNIYISYQKYFSEDRIDAFYKTIYSNLGKNIQTKIDNMRDNKSIINEEIFFQEVRDILEDMYNNMQEDEKKALIKKISETKEEYDNKIAQEQRKTVIHKISINDGKIEYKTKGEVQGYLLNQFSLDEKDRNLRVATTNSFWTRDKGSQSYNNVYVLDDNLKQIGKIEKLAEDEKIYSTRFIGDKLYMVTFKQVDPLFVIDLSVPSNPNLLGKLKIPGYSNYLHPVDETHLIGVGMDTKESEFGGIINNGVKISLFDISDFENPKEIDNYIIEGRYTKTLVSEDHKAFLFSKEKQLLVLPITEYIENSNTMKYETKYAQSAFVFNYSENGFKLKGKITHETYLEDNYYWYNRPSTIKRTLYMDDILYTISEKKIHANNLNDLNKIKEIDLGYEKDIEISKPYIYY